MKLKITRATLKSLTPGKAPVWVFDTVLAGFGIKLQPSGAASYVVAFRIRGSRAKKTVTLGPVAALSPEAARERARTILAAAREGRDLDREARERSRQLETEKRERANRLTVAAARDAFLADIELRDSPRTGRPAAPATLRATRLWLTRLVERHGELGLSDLSREQIEHVLAAAPAGSRRNSFGAIARLLAWAKRQGHVAALATEDVERPAQPASRTNTPTPEEVRRLLDTADRLAATGRWAPVQRDVAILILLTGQRRSEVATMDWRDLDLARALWTQPAKANKARREHAIPLSERVVALLAARWQAAGQPASGLVLPGMRTGAAMTASLSDFAEVLRAETGIAFRFHDARRAMISACAERGVAFEVLDTLLNHAASQSRGGLRGVYNRATLLDQMRRAVVVWDGAVFGTVVPLRRPA